MPWRETWPSCVATRGPARFSPSVAAGSVLPISYREDRLGDARILGIVDKVDKRSLALDLEMLDQTAHRLVLIRPDAHREN
jgi:hypothetical protein